MIPEQEKLLAKARASYRAAGLLAEQGFFDFSISRSYYTMFYVAEAFLLGKNLAFSKHSAVISAFNREFIKTGSVAPEFKKYITDAEDSRKVGDYEFNESLSKEEAYLHLERAKKFLELAEQLIGPTLE
jgi:uncharacterized protein (UPF0332 family)